MGHIKLFQMLCQGVGKLNNFDKIVTNSNNDINFEHHASNNIDNK
jgi:hypothetical protein